MQYLVNAEEIRALDQLTIEGTPHHPGISGAILMRNAGREVARVCLSRLAGREGTVVIIAGGGNNGGDGLVIAEALHAAGKRVRVFLLAAPGDLRGDAAAALKAFEATNAPRITSITDGGRVQALTAALAHAELVVDAIFGTGLNAEITGRAAQVIEAINASEAPCVSVDIPSGVSADTGAVLGHAVWATHTVTFAYPKCGLVLHPGAARCGTVEVVDIGIPSELVKELGVNTRVLSAGDGRNLFPTRPADAHKGRFGHLAVVAGSPEFPGAGILALRGALRSGVGLVSWITDEKTLGRMAPPNEVMLRVPSESAQNWATQALQGTTAVTVGPGLGQGEAAAARLDAILEESQVPMCLDADALNLLADQPSRWARVCESTVLTPHPGEMARLVSPAKSVSNEERAGQLARIQSDRLVSARELAARRGCVVVLKGAGTVIANPAGDATVIGAGTPALARGGTGDVLAGVIGSLLAQGMAPYDAACAGALLHARAGERAAQTHGVMGTCAGDVADALSLVLQEWGAGVLRRGS